VFDENYILKDAGAMRVPDNAGFDPGMEIAVTPKQIAFINPIRPQQKGYIYIWVSNECENTKVWFDDLKITHRSRRVTQAIDYYAYGSVLREQKTPEELTYRYKYQGQFAEKDEETGWSHFELREYDPVIVRFTSTDPAGQFNSPFVGMSNDPINGTDPDGGYFFGLFGSTKQQRDAARNTADLTGGEIANITKRNISVTAFDNNSWYNDPIEGYNTATNHSWNYTFDKGGNYDVSINQFTVLSMATGRVDFDPLGQYMLGSLAVGVSKGMSVLYLRTGIAVMSFSGPAGKAFFWSGISSTEASTIALTRGAYTMAETSGGRFLNQGLSKVALRIIGDKTAYRYIWAPASRKFASSAIGDVTFYSTGYRVVIWRAIEYPTLRSNFNRIIRIP